MHSSLYSGSLIKRTTLRLLLIALRTSEANLIYLSHRTSITSPYLPSLIARIPQAAFTRHSVQAQVRFLFATKVKINHNTLAHCIAAQVLHHQTLARTHRHFPRPKRQHVAHRRSRGKSFLPRQFENLDLLYPIACPNVPLVRNTILRPPFTVSGRRHHHQPHWER